MRRAISVAIVAVLSVVPAGEGQARPNVRQYRIRVDTTSSCRFEILDDLGNDARHEHISRGDSVSWISNTGGLLIDFASGHYPFSQPPPFSASQGSPTTRVNISDDTPSGSYWYYATVTPKDCTARIEIIVN